VKDSVERRNLVDAACLALGAAALAYLVLKMTQAGTAPGYDLRFFWAAGRLWLQGINPYAEGYDALAAQMITSGNVPELWAYPPHFYPIAAFLGLFDLNVASWIWAAANVAMLIASAWLVARVADAPGPAAQPIGALTTGLDEAARRRRFCLLLFALAVLEGAAITLVTGQASILAFFGVSLFAFGLARGVGSAAIAGLAIASLKPQIGAAFVLMALSFGAEGRRAVIGAVVVSALAAAPALILSIAAPFEWLRNVGEYDVRFPRGSAAEAMTGVRVLIKDGFGLDIGTMTATLAALGAVGAVLALFATAWRAARDVETVVAAVSLTLVALAPLHLYDLVLVGATLMWLAREADARMLGLAAFGAALMWRAEDVADRTGFHSPIADVFAGSRLATIGALVMALALFWALRARAARQASAASMALP